MVSNAKGISSLTILIMAIVGIIAFWEVNQYVKIYLFGDGSSTNNSTLDDLKANCPSGIIVAGKCDDDTDEGAPNPAAPPICKTGNSQDCNDSGDVFKFTK